MKTMNRREFLSWSAKGAAAAWAWAGAGPLLAATGPASGLPANAVAELPARGLAYVVNDFHAGWDDYGAFKKMTRVLDRMAAGEDVYLVINGDTVDTKPGHSQPDGDARILDDLMEHRERLRQAGQEKRLVLLLGNHEQQGAAIHECLVLNNDLVLAKPGKDQVVRRDVLLKALEEEKKNWASFDKNRREASLTFYVSQFNFARRMKPEHLSFIRAFQLMARCGNGVFIMHASYPRPGSLNPVHDLLWQREGDGAAFLAESGGELIVNGHTAPILFGGQYQGLYDQERKMGIAGGDRVIIAPSYGAGGGTFLALDLSTVYRTGKDLRAGREVVRLRQS